MIDDIFWTLTLDCGPSSFYSSIASCLFPFFVAGIISLRSLTRSVRGYCRPLNRPLCIEMPLIPYSLEDMFIHYVKIKVYDCAILQRIVT